MNPDRLIATLQRDEGFRSRPYADTVGAQTIGYGRNLDAKGISQKEAAYLLESDIEEAAAQLDKNLPWWRDLDAPRQEVLLNMALNMGAAAPGKGLLSFKNTLAHIKAGRFTKASRGMLASKWARQVKGRARRLALVMQTGSPVHFGVRYKADGET